MKRLSRLLRPVGAAVLFVSGFASFGSLSAQGSAPRLTQPITGESRTVLANSRPPRALPANDAGAVSPDTPLQGITLVLSRTSAQQSAINTLLTAQSDPASPLYHQWLTPEQFAARFGVADADLATVETWLQGQGFAVNRVARSRDRITFSGTAGQVAAAFGTELHNYRSGSETHFAPSSDLSLPSALAPMVTTVLNLSSFRLEPSLRIPPPRPQYTSSVSGAYHLDPLDIATQYNVNAVYKAGYNGAGQSIAIAGQSWITIADVQKFSTALGLSTINTPNLVLMPGSGVSGIQLGDEGESDLDVEYSGAMAPGAKIFFVYTGDNTTYGAFDALSYAIEEDLAPIVSLSYGACELDYSPTDLTSFSNEGDQANLQGQTLITAAGDNGSTGCYGDTNLTTAQSETPAVSVPADLPSFTGIGGLQMAAGTFTAGNTQYFQSANGSDNYSSLLSYVPEVIWNEDSTGGLSSGGGGTSVAVPRPTWQAGVPGISAGAYRLVPDLSLQASGGSPGYLLCSSDASIYVSGLNTSCSNGLRDANGNLTLAGGTSFGAPIFAGMLAVLNQAVHAAGQGNINPTLYGLAASSTTYASAFHDITGGTNACTAGANFCSAAGEAVYSAAAGYDEASGLGSINFANLVAAWPTSQASALLPSYTSISLTGGTTTAGSSQQAIVTVSGTGTTPTGTVTLLLDGNTVATVTLTSGTGTASYTAPTANGTHALVAIYSGDTLYASSTGTVPFTLGSTEATGSFNLAAANTSLLVNGSGVTTISVTPSGGYTGDVTFSLTASSSLAICFTANDVSAYKGAPITTQLTLAEGTPCTGASARIGTGAAFRRVPGTGVSRLSPPPAAKSWPAPVALAGLLLGAFAFRKRSRSLPALFSCLALLAFGLGLSGCGGSNGNAGSTTIGGTPQTVTVTLVGTDSVNTAIANSTTFTLTVNP